MSKRNNKILTIMDDRPISPQNIFYSNKLNENHFAYEKYRK